MDAATYDAFVRAAPGAAAPVQVGITWIEGPDAATFLNGLLTADVAGVVVGDSVPALLLDERGHILAEMMVLREQNDMFTLVGAPGQVDTATATFSRLHFTEDLDILGPEVMSAVVTTGTADDAEIRVRGPLPGTVTAVGEAVVERLAHAEAGAGAALEAARVFLGIPRVGVDTGPKTLVQEAGLEGSHVSFSKGCYLGQETVARAQHRGGVRKTLRRLYSRDALTPGAPVSYGGATVGEVTSAAELPSGEWVALAALRTSVPEGAEINVEGSRARADQA